MCGGVSSSWKEKPTPRCSVRKSGSPDSLPEGQGAADLGADESPNSVEFPGTQAFCLSSPWSTPVTNASLKVDYLGPGTLGFLTPSWGWRWLPLGGSRDSIRNFL